MSTRQPLTAVDSAWLRMEHPTNLMTITGVMTFRGIVDFHQLKGLIEDKLLCHPRFRQKVVEPRLPLASPRWEDDELFDLHRHLHRVALPEPRDKACLQEMVSDLMATPLDRSRPLWQMHYIDNFKGGSALITRIHHCIGDGISLMQVVLGMADPGEQPSLPKVGHNNRRKSRGLAETLLHEGAEVLANPARLQELWQSGGEAAKTLGRLVTLSADADTPLRGPLCVRKRVAWSAPIPLEQVKLIGRRLGATLNDVLMSAVAGALRTYLLQREVAADGLDVRVVVPVNLRPPDEHTLGNKFGLVFLALPVGLADPVARLAKIKERMDRIKGSPEAFVTFGLLQAVGMTTAQVEEIVLNIFGQKATGVATNVPGPQQPIHFCGVEVDGVMFWVPQSGRLGLGISILSYVGKVRIGIATDTGLVADPEAIVEAYHQALDELAEVAARAAAEPPA